MLYSISKRASSYQRYYYYGGIAITFGGLFGSLTAAMSVTGIILLLKDILWIGKAVSILSITIL